MGQSLHAAVRDPNTSDRSTNGSGLLATDACLSPMVVLLPPTLFCLGVALRAYKFWAPPLWIDEYITWWAVAASNWPDFKFLAQQGQAPLYYVLLKLVSSVLGTSPFSLRLPSLCFGIATLWIAYKVARLLFQDKQAVILTVATFAFNQQLIGYSQDARPYALALLCALLSCFFYLSLLRADSSFTRIGYVLATAATFYAHYFFAFIAFLQVLHLVLTRGWRGVVRRPWLLTLVVLGLACLPGAVQLLGLFGNRATLDWIEARTWGAPLRLALDFLDAPMLSAMAITVLFVGTRSMTEHGPEGDAVRHLLVWWLLLPIAFFGFLPPLIGVNVLLDRYLLFALPAALLILALLMAQGTRRGLRRWVPLGLFIMLNCAWYLIPALRTTGTFTRHLSYDQRWQAAAAAVSRATPNDLILLRTGIVEGDFVVESRADRSLLSFLEWPLIAHLPANHSYRILDLPFRRNDATRPYLRELLIEAGKSEHVWLVGTGDMVPDMADTLATTASFHITSRTKYGAVIVIVLNKNAE